MPEDVQLALVLAAQNGDITITGTTDEIEQVAAEYWSGEKGSGPGIHSIFPFRRTDPEGNLYIIHRDVLLYLNLLFTGTNIDYLYNYRIEGEAGEFSKEMKEAVREAVILKNHEVILSGALMCEALSKTIRGYDELTPKGGIEVSAKNPLSGSAVFQISKRAFDRISREENDLSRELEAMAQRNESRSRKRYPMPVS